MTSDAAPHIDLVDPLLPELIALQRRDRCLLPEALVDLAPEYRWTEQQRTEAD